MRHLYGTGVARLHNGIAFLLEDHPICSSAHVSRVPEVEQTRPWMQRYSEALFRDSADQDDPKAAREEIARFAGYRSVVERVAFFAKAARRGR